MFTLSGSDAYFSRCRVTRCEGAAALRQVDIEVTAPNEDANAIARARAQLPNVDLPITQRNAQLVIAREYGYAGWRDLTADVSKRLDQGLEWAVAQGSRRKVYFVGLHHGQPFKFAKPLPFTTASGAWHRESR